MDKQTRIFVILFIVSLSFSFAIDPTPSLSQDNEIPPPFSFQYRYAKRNAVEHDDVWQVSEAKHGMISIDEIRTSISWGFHEAFYLDLIFGRTSWETDNFAHNTYNQDFDYNWLWGIGLRQYLLWTVEEYEIHLLLSFEYTTTSKQTDRNLQGELKQWNVSGNWLIPIEPWILSAGIYYSDFDMTYWHPSNLGTRRGGFEAENNIGVLWGAQCFFDRNLCLWSTIHLLAQKGITVGINWSF